MEVEDTEYAKGGDGVTTVSVTKMASEGENEAIRTRVARAVVADAEVAEDGAVKRIILSANVVIVAEVTNHVWSAIGDQGNATDDVAETITASTNQTEKISTTIGDSEDGIGKNTKVLEAMMPISAGSVSQMQCIQSYDQAPKACCIQRREASFSSPWMDCDF
eukprot:GDKK01047099.1.p1 GENE.GDKK01047099.1~~GDKK01047099.1.p1  ORF type:complete len:163 (+),score=19.10 GDKK01047099.1:438-926(+)